MFYKVIGNDMVLDVIKNPQYITYQERNKLVMRSKRSDARGILSSDGSTTWHVSGWEKIPLPGIATVRLIEIEEDEYAILREAMMSGGSIPEQELEYEPSPSIVTLEYVKEKKISKMKADCETAIVNGVDVVFSDGMKHHFDLTIEDQINLISLKEMIVAGATEIPYHEKGCLCRMYAPEDISILLDAASYHKTFHVTYFNSLKGYINSLNSIEAVSDVRYGMSIPEVHWSEVLAAIVETGGASR